MKCIGESAKTISDHVKKHLECIKNQEELMNYDQIDKDSKDQLVDFRGNKYKHIFDDKLAKDYCYAGSKRTIVPYVYLKPYRDKIIKHIIESDIKLHIYYRNFNSSQGVVLNFLGPIINTKYESEFSEYVFGIKDGQFEIEHVMEDRGSDSKSSSEIDFTIRAGETLHFFEAKYTEQGFGRVSISNKNKKYDTDKYRDKWFGRNESLKINNGRVCVHYNRLVSDNIMKHIPFDDKEQNNRDTFTKNYQLIRNLYNTVYSYQNNQIRKRHSIGRMHVIVLKDNKTHCREFNRFSGLVKDKSIVNESSYLTWQSLCEKAIQFASSKDDGDLKYHYELFKKVFLDYDKR